MSDPRRTGTYDIRQDPEFEDIIKVALRAEKLTIRTSTIATVIATDSQPLGFDPATQLCSVQVQQPRVVKDRENPTLAVVKPPTIIKNIQVYFPRSSSGYLTFPISVGDTGELIVQDRDPGKWYLQGTPVDPVSRFTHNLAFGVFHPGISPQTNRIQGFDATAAVLEAALIKLGANANAEFAALGTSLLAFLIEFVATYNAHTHVVTGTTPPGGGALVGGVATPTPSTQTPPDGAAILSSKVLIE